MELLDLALFLLPFLILLPLVPLALRAFELNSAELLRSFRITFSVYAALVLAAGLIGGPFTALSSFYYLLIVILVGREAFSAHAWGSLERNLFAAMLVFFLVPVLIAKVVTLTAATVALLWLLNLVGVCAFSALWLTRTQLSDTNKGRVVASAAYVAAITSVGLLPLAVAALQSRV